MKITVGIPTKSRYDYLSHTILSMAFQSKKPYEIIICDDTDVPIDLREIPIYNYILKLLDEYKIRWKVIFGRKLGPHHSHSIIQEIAEGDFIFRIDDDCVAEPDVLEQLSLRLTEGVGAVAPLVLMPPASSLPSNSDNKISNLNLPNVQWFKWNGIKDVEHLYSCFLYRKNIAQYELSLSTKGNREETIFSHKIKRAGYKLLVYSPAVVWHFRSSSGGIRSDNNISDYDNDEKIFNGILNLWNVKTENSKTCVIDAGIGDHYAFKTIIPLLKKKYNKIIIAACYPDIFFDEEGLDIISIAEAIKIYNDISSFSIYGWMDKNNWKKSLTEAFKEMYL